MISEKLLDMLVCPVSKKDLEYDKENQELICHASGLVYAVQDDIPIKIREKARQISTESPNKAVNL